MGHSLRIHVMVLHWTDDGIIIVALMTMQLALKHLVHVLVLVIASIHLDLIYLLRLH